MKTSSPRKSGGQPGNTNAVTHGFYSQRFKKKLLVGSPDPNPNNLKEEIVLLRIFLRRIIELGETKELAYAEAKTLLRLICTTTGNINNLVKTEHLLIDGRPPYAALIGQVLAELSIGSASATDLPLPDDIRLTTRSKKRVVSASQD
jgi:hypothetical protein